MVGERWRLYGLCPDFWARRTWAAREDLPPVYVRAVGPYAPAHLCRPPLLQKQVRLVLAAIVDKVRCVVATRRAKIAAWMGVPCSEDYVRDKRLRVSSINTSPGLPPKAAEDRGTHDPPSL